MGNILSQFYFIPSATLTEKNCPDQTGRVSRCPLPSLYPHITYALSKVFIITGGYTGVGLELSKILYAHNATVHIAGRSATKAETALANIRAASPNSTGHLAFLELDLANLSTIKPAVETFLASNSRLDVLVNNAGVMIPPKGSLDAQGHDLQVGTNCLGPYLLYQLLLPLLAKTAATAPTASVRVAWAASIAAQVAAPGPSGMVLDGEGQPVDKGQEVNYAQTKVGNIFMARLFAKETENKGVLHVAFNPGNLATELGRHWQGIVASITVSELSGEQSSKYWKEGGCFRVYECALTYGMMVDCASRASGYLWGIYGVVGRFVA